MQAKMFWMMGSLIGLALLAAAIQRVQADEFYRGKTIRFVVGQAAGGGYDLAAGLILVVMILPFPDGVLLAWLGIVG